MGGGQFALLTSVGRQDSQIVGSVLGLLGLFQYSPGLIMKCVCMEGALMAEMAAMNTPLFPLGNFKAPSVCTK